VTRRGGVSFEAALALGGVLAETLGRVATAGFTAAVREAEGEADEGESPAPFFSQPSANMGTARTATPRAARWAS
jgi:hypothetical protein